MTETQRIAIRDAQVAYLDENWDDYDALVERAAWCVEIGLDEAYRLVEEGPIVRVDTLKSSL